jgi:hypothetical protein
MKTMIRMGTGDWGLVWHEMGVHLPFCSTGIVDDVKVDLAEDILADVRGHQLGERLAHCTDGILHCSRADRVVLGSAVIISIALSKDQDDGEGVIEVLDKRVNFVLETNGLPESPMCVRCFGAFSSDTQSGILLDKAEVKAEIVSFWSGSILQGIICGNEELK